MFLAQYNCSKKTLSSLQVVAETVRSLLVFLFKGLFKQNANAIEA